MARIFAILLVLVFCTEAQAKGKSDKKSHKERGKRGVRAEVRANTNAIIQNAQAIAEIDASAGPIGPQGPAGNDGQVGPIGQQGLAGADGAEGPQGPVGLMGLTGEQGLIGPQGPAGVIGPQGQKGDSGAQGIEGLQGIPGPSGLAGTDGNQGPAGEQGLVGPQGPSGIAGVIGPQGQKGDAGVQGAEGPQGISGPIGLAGTDGNQGPAGEQGPIGPRGLPGEVGSAGIEGPQGLPGAIGPEGPSGINGLNADMTRVQANEQSIIALQNLVTVLTARIEQLESAGSSTPLVSLELNTSAPLSFTETQSTFESMGSITGGYVLIEMPQLPSANGRTKACFNAPEFAALASQTNSASGTFSLQEHFWMVDGGAWTSNSLLEEMDVFIESDQSESSLYFEFRYDNQVYSAGFWEGDPDLWVLGDPLNITVGDTRLATCGF